MQAYPLSAVVGMDDLRLALLLSSVAPEAGGVLVRGEKGTAKSTAVRALAALLPPVSVVAGCRFRCDPAAPDLGCPDGCAVRSEGPPGATSRPARLVELPVGASEDRLLGSLDLERALTAGQRAYEPGLLAGAHRGILYVDEVNLLPDHLVDVLLDAAAMGRVHVERDGVSVSHAARFVLVGTMNPEEGELRPQLLDRFGLAVDVRASREPEERVEVVRRRLAFDADPAGFAAAWRDAEQELADRVVAARGRLPGVVLSDGALRRIAALCAAFDVDGMRADLVVARIARAHAAWCGRDEVSVDDIRVAARFALPHRGRRDPFDPAGLDEQRLDEALDAAEAAAAHEPDGRSPGHDEPDGRSAERDEPEPALGAAAEGDPDPAPDDPDPEGGPPRGPGGGQRLPTPAGATYRVRTLRVDGVGEGTPGRRSRALGPSGRVVAARPATSGRHRSSGGVHIPATLTAAAPHQQARGRSGAGLVLRAPDLRLAVREGRESNLVLFCVDASGSMAARRRMTEVKAAVLSLLLDAYQRRDRVGLVTFRGSTAQLALPPTGAVELARTRLEGLPTGGRTPLSEGLRLAHTVITTERLREPTRRPLLVVVTDGRHTAGTDPSHVASALARRDVRSIVVDCESGPVRLGLAGRLAAYLEGDVVRIDGLRGGGIAGGLTGLVRERTGTDADRRTA